MSWQEDFERLKPQIESALTYNAGTQNLEDVRRRLEDGSFTMWATKNSVAIIESTVLSGKKYVVVALGAGDLDELKEVLSQIENESKKLGFNGVMIIGRRGWGRVFLEYKEKATVYIKEI